MPIEIKDFSKYYIIQLWSDDDPRGNNLESFVKYVGNELTRRNKAKIIEIDGPTSYLPDFFSELFDYRAGYLMSIEKSVNPYDLKRTCMELEINENGKRICDIDIYIDRKVTIITDCNGKDRTYSDLKSIHRKDMQIEKFKEHRRLNAIYLNFLTKENL
ncbi:MAG TPA: hypothetical protein VEC16_06870 [Alphaproteobacteria bacterium]|nr:hypothetical protein [Alphaproteobacteria bacterium]